MKRTPVIRVFGIVVSLIFLTLSCATVKEKRADVESPGIGETPEGAGLLADTHQAAGISCSDCHEESPPADAVPDAVCLTCHGDYKELTASYEDPHNAHIAFPDCGNCHHAHQPSENQCLACHSFEVQAP